MQLFSWVVAGFADADCGLASLNPRVHLDRLCNRVCENGDVICNEARTSVDAADNRQRAQRAGHTPATPRITFRTTLTCAPLFSA